MKMKTPLAALALVSASLMLSSCSSTQEQGEGVLVPQKDYDAWIDELYKLEGPIPRGYVEVALWSCREWMDYGRSYSVPKAEALANYKGQTIPECERQLEQEVAKLQEELDLELELGKELSP